jgi:4-diphosphocytidyl-2-C-methyl-D-erythritol kinase
MKAMAEKDLAGVGTYAFNLFESVILPHHTEARGLKDYFAEQGATLSMMSGSGPSVFGLFARREEARAACDGLVARGVAAHLCEPCK